VQSTSSPKQVTFARLIGTSISAKLLVDIGVQIFNPFLPIIASGLGLDIITLGRLVGLRSLMGVFAPISGVIADRTSYRRVIRVALLINALGLVVLAAGNGLWMAAGAMILIGLGASAFVPNLQAYVSGRLPYAIRARGLGMLEYSWALTGIVGLSMVGLIIQFVNWRVPFLLLAAGMIVMALVFGRMPAAHSPQATGPEASAARNAALHIKLRALRAFFNLGQTARSTYATMLAGSLSYFAAMQLMIAYGAWLEQQYGLGPAQLGLVAFVFGWFDLAASISVSLFTDRIGKRRSVLIGILGSLLGYLAMPFLNTGVVLATLAIALTRMCFEFNIVSHFPLLSEQAPSQRGKVMTLGAAVSLLGGTLAGFTGPWLLIRVGVAGLAWSSAAAAFIGLLVVLLLVNEPGNLNTTTAQPV
jgi:predicted MFS family arabinose efflux permease